VKRVKLRFPFTNFSNEPETETMWTIPREKGFEIDNIPFYVKELALGDIVAAEPDADGLLWYSKLMHASGHSTIRLWFATENDVARVRDDLKKLGCTSEVSDLSRLVAVDVPPTVAYRQVKAFLDEGERAGTFEYQEACLGQTSKPQPDRTLN
jgi:hypothetical protein